MFGGVQSRLFKKKIFIKGRIAGSCCCWLRPRAITVLRLTDQSRSARAGPRSVTLLARLAPPLPHLLGERALGDVRPVGNPDVLPQKHRVRERRLPNPSQPALWCEGEKAQGPAVRERRVPNDLHAPGNGDFLKRAAHEALAGDFLDALRERNALEELTVLERALKYLL